MKKCILLMFFTLISAIALGQHKPNDLIGKWQGTDSEGTTELISFRDSSKVLVSINGKEMPVSNYAVDFSKEPVTLDIKFAGDDGQTATLLGFVVFVDDDTIKWQIFPKGNRLAAFDENSADAPVITLKRIKD